MSPRKSDVDVEIAASQYEIDIGEARPGIVELSIVVQEFAAIIFDCGGCGASRAFALSRREAFPLRRRSIASAGSAGTVLERA